MHLFLTDKKESITYSQGTSPTMTKSPSSSSYVSTWHLSGCTPFISVPPVNKRQYSTDKY